MTYTHLHCHGVNSLLDGLTKPKDLVIKAKELGFHSLALTDHGSVSGSIKFYNACRDNDINPILGIEAYFVNDASKHEKGDKRYHIILLAKSLNGFKSICKLMTKAHKEENFYYFPRFDIGMLLEAEDIIVSTACSYGILTNPNSERIVQILKDRFKEDFYLEVMPLFFEQQLITNKYAIELHEKYNIRLIATNDIHYLHKEDSKIHNFLLKMNTKGRLQFDISGLYMRTEEEMIEEFSKMDMEEHYYLDAINNTEEIARKIDIQWPKMPIQLPHVCEGNPIDVLGQRLSSFTLNGEYKKRLDYELGIIEQKGFADYFLMVHDMIERAKKKNMELGPGRGSSAGSLGCYILDITGIDPIKEGLMFERFLNPERTDYPDIDIDFPRSRRKEVIDDLKEVFGSDRVANLSTVSELKLKSAFKDVAREYGVSFLDSNRISKLLDNDKTMEEMFIEDANVRKELMSLKNGQEIVNMVQGISGTLRQSGTHAAGVVVAPYPVTEFGVMERRGGDYCLNWDMSDAEHLGLVKIDVLGLRTLDIIGEARRLIRNRHGKLINWKTIKVDSEKILNEFGKGNTVGIFQFESMGMTRLVKQLKKISSKNVLIDCNALGRPGPLDSGLTELYIKRHHGDTTYDEPYVEWLRRYDIAKDTYRVIIYQEQIIEILQKIAGYSIPEADIVRRIFAKKKGDMNEQRQKFVDGCKETSEMPEVVSNRLFDALENFSRYGFNKSHAAAYTQLGLRQMWLKVNYPIEYMSALYRWTDEVDKTDKFIDESARLGIKILLPDVNKSGIDFSIDGENLRIGLRSIKGVGEVALKSIMLAREKGEFRGLEDFKIRVSKANKTVINNMVLTGCFDEVDKINKGFFMENNEVFYDVHNNKKKIPEDVREMLTDGLYSEESLMKEEEELWKISLLEGVYRIDMEPKVGLNIDTERLGRLRDAIADCDACVLRKAYDCPVAMEYHSTSKLFILAEAPGKDEVKEGRPLIGDAGTILMDILESHGIMRKDCYLSNVFKCRPMNNRLPEGISKECYKILNKEIEITEPKLMLALGGTAMEFIIGNKIGIQAKSASLRVYMELLSGKKIVPVVYGVHPASLLYERSEDNRKLLEDAIGLVADIFYGMKENKGEKNE